MKARHVTQASEQPVVAHPREPRGDEQGPQLVTGLDIARRLGIARDTWARWVRRGLAPAPVPNLPGYPRWNAREIDQFAAGVTRTPGRRSYFGTARVLRQASRRPVVSLAHDNKSVSRPA